MKQTAVEWLIEKIAENYPLIPKAYREECNIAKEMEKNKHEKFNKLLNDEKEFGLCDLKTIERIQWYYNTYFNEFFNTKEK
jgi:hypothetical protein